MGLPCRRAAGPAWLGVSLVLCSLLQFGLAQYIALNCGGHTTQKNPYLPSYYGSVQYGLGPDYQGNNSYVASDGTQYQADAFYQGTSNHVTDYYSVQIANTNDPVLYQTERYGLDLYYEFNVPSGAYTVELHFAENLYSNIGQRQFSILVQGVQVEDHFDIVAQAGAWQTALVRQYPAAVTNGLLEIYMNSEIYEAQICAIRIFPTSSGPGSTALAAPSSQVRIDCGGTTDYYYQGGTAGTVGAVSGTSLTSYFQTYRHGPNLVYYLNLPKGDYTVEFAFIEPDYAAAGSRLIDVYMQTVPVFKKLDIYANAKGQNTALILSAAAHVPNGLLRIQFVGTLGQAVISGINVYPLPSSTNTQVAINCGSPIDVLAGTGVIYTLDSFFSGGNALVTQPYQVFLPYLSLWDDFLYVSARTGASTYSIPIPNGYYTVEMRFAEIENMAAGQRVFNILVQGQQVYTGVDVVELTGAVITPIILTAPAVVTNGVLTVAFTDNAIINALYVIPAVPSGAPISGPAAAPLSANLFAYSPAPAPISPSPLVSFPSPAPAPAPAPLKSIPAPAPAPNYGLTLGIDVGEPNANYTSSSMRLSFLADTIQCMTGAVNGSFQVPVGAPFCWSNSGNVSQGGFYRVPANAPIANTSDATLYQTARYGGVGYSINVPNGYYFVTAYFAELDKTVAVGDRVFHIAYNGVVLQPNFDPLAAAKGALYTAYTVVKRVTVTEGVLRIQLLQTLPPSRSPPFLSALSLRAA